MGEFVAKFSPEHAQKETARIPESVRGIDRRAGMLAVVDKLGYISRGTVEKLGESLARNSESSLSEVVSAIQGRPIKRDCFLERVSLFFTPEELSRTYTSTAEIPPFVVDVLAGEGSAKPLLKRLYSLESRGLVVSEEIDGKETFFPTNWGRVRADDTRRIISDVKLPRGLLFQLGPDGIASHIIKKPVAA